MQTFNVNPYPIEVGNAERLRQVCLGMIPFAMLRYEAISIFYTEEPFLIHVLPSEDGKRHTLQQVFRLRIWIPNTACNSWCVYSSEREWFDSNGNTSNLIIRHVLWDRSHDMNLLKAVYDNDKCKDEALREEARARWVSGWPYIDAKTMYLDVGTSRDLVDTFVPIDEALSKGITLRERSDERERPEWMDFEIKRLFDWGQVHTTWCPFVENPAIERLMQTLQVRLEECMGGSVEKVYQMDLDYSIPPHIYKALVQGARVGIFSE